MRRHPVPGRPSARRSRSDGASSAISCEEREHGIDTTQIYTRIKPAQLKRAVAFYEAQARRMLTG